VLDLNRPIKFEPPIFLRVAQKAVHSVLVYFSPSFSPCPPENMAGL